MVDDKRSTLFYHFDNKNSFIMPIPVKNIFEFNLTKKYELA